MYLQIVRFPASLSKSLQLTRHPIICEFSNCALSYISFHIHCNWLVLRSFVNFKLTNKKFQKLFIFWRVLTRPKFSARQSPKLYFQDQHFWCFNIRCNPSLSWRTVPFYALIVQRLTSNWIIEETPREKPLSPKFNLPFDKNGDKKFLTPQRMFVAKKWGR